MARCSPTDKFELVSLLRELGEVVAVTGDGTNDAPALKEADIGFSMGISGTQIAMNASDIVLLDDNFASIVQAIRWGRNVLNTIRKFLQFQLGINMTAVIVTFIGSLTTGTSPLSTVQLLWINLIMDSFGALGLASDEPDAAILEEPPQKRADSLLTPAMNRYIIVQTIYQTFVVLLLIFAGDRIFLYHNGVLPPIIPSIRAKTMVFNTFILMQITNIICARTIREEINIFSGILKNRLFIAIIFIILGVQLFAIAVASSLFNAVPLSLEEWGWCALFASINIPLVTLSRVAFNLHSAHYASRMKNKITIEDRYSRGSRTSADFEQPKLDRKPSLPEILRGKFKTEMPLPTKSKSLASLRSVGSKGSRN
jgi:Ca2+-transporting ATPase